MEARYQVFVSSTYEDLKEERKEAVQAILEMDCFPAGMELFPASDKKQWDIIKKVIDDSDFYLLVLGGRYGSLGKDDRGMPVGYTEMEFDYAIRENKPVFAFIHEKPDTLPAARVERTEDGIARLNQFREKVKSNGTVMFWSNKDDLKASILKTLNDKRKEIRDEEGKTEGWIRYEQRFGWIRERKPVKEFIEKAEKSIFITGNSLNSLYDSPTLLHELLSRGLEVKLILLSNEGLKKNCIQLGAGYDKMKSMIRITLRRLKTYQEEFLNKNLIVKEVKEPLWTNIIARDVDRDNGVIGANHLLFDVPPSDCLYVEFRKGEQFYDIYKRHMEHLWEIGREVDFGKVPKE